MQPKCQWLVVEACPACGGSRRACSSPLRVDEYRHGDEVIPLPQGGVYLVRCGECGLVFKNIVPSPSFLEEVFARQAGKMWASGYDFSEEASLIRELVDGKACDSLDIGASEGGLLRALHDLEGRRSALDIVMYPGLETSIQGEFVHGLADSQDLSWSCEPYDVVTMFDVAEHLYSPSQAFANLQHMVKPGGFIVVETGNAESAWPRKFGVHRWWYACRFEHHNVWSKESFEKLAAEHGFRTVQFRRKRHKERAKMPLWRDLVDTLGIALYYVSPAGYGRLTKLAGKYRPQPWSPYTHDHFRIVLRKVGPQG